jgi:hypothetical protein
LGWIMENKYQKTSYEMVRIGRREIITQLSQPAHAESLFRLYPSSDSLPFLQNLIDRNWGRFSKPNLMILSWTDRESRESQKGRWLEREGETSRERGGEDVFWREEGLSGLWFGWDSGGLDFSLYRLVYASYPRPWYALKYKTNANRS